MGLFGKKKKVKEPTIPDWTIGKDGIERDQDGNEVIEFEGRRMTEEGWKYFYPHLYSAAYKNRKS